MQKCLFKKINKKKSKEKLYRFLAPSTHMGIPPSLPYCVSVVAAVRAQGAEEHLLPGPPPLLRGGAADGRGWQDLLQGAEVRQEKTPGGQFYDCTTQLIS